MLLVIILIILIIILVWYCILERFEENINGGIKINAPLNTYSDVSMALEEALTNTLYFT